MDKRYALVLVIPTRLTPRHLQVKYLQLGGGFGGPENDVVLETQLQHKRTNYFKKHLASANLEAYDTGKHIRIELIAQNNDSNSKDHESHSAREGIPSQDQRSNSPLVC